MNSYPSYPVLSHTARLMANLEVLQVLRYNSGTTYDLTRLDHVETILFESDTRDAVCVSITYTKCVNLWTGQREVTQTRSSSFSIDTGNRDLIRQRPYPTPLNHRHVIIHNCS